MATKVEGIDVSVNSGHLGQDFWNKAYERGIRFAYIRCSYGRTGIDEEFQNNAACAHNAGMKVGAYHSGYALNMSQAEHEAKHCQQVIADAEVVLDLPVFYAMGDIDGYKASHGFAFNPYNIANICQVFLANIQLDSGIRASLSWLNNYIRWRNLECPIWSVQQGDSDDMHGYVWQDSDRYYIDGHKLGHDYMYME